MSLSSSILLHHCDSCERLFRSEWALQIHSSCHATERFSASTIKNEPLNINDNLKNGCIHSEIAQFVSDKGEKRLSCKSTSKRRVHVPDSEKPFACDVCQKRYCLKNSLRNHQLVTHMGKAPYVCDTCGKGFGYKCHLVQHSRIHSKKISEVTSDADDPGKKKSSRKKSLKDHQILAYMGKVPFVCDTCGKGFGYNCQLVRHNRIHTEERPYKCGECEKAFHTSWNLKIHTFTHIGQQPYICDICSKRFTQNRILQKHLRTIHITAADLSRQ